MDRSKLGRLLLVAAGLMLLGLLTTIAVAWGLAAWLPHRTLWRYSEYVNAPQATQIDRIQIVQISRPGMVRREWYAHVPQTLASVYFDLHYVQANERAQPIADYWGELGALLRGGSVIDRSGLEDARGWPLPALWCGFERNWVSSGRVLVEISGGIRLTDDTADALGVRALPLRPIWRGLIVNTMFYAGVWALVFGVVWVRPLRRRYRRVRGLCAGCGYDLRGLSAERCPECGCGGVNCSTAR